MTHIITRFAPSPTGYLHIGGARTALFNYLFAKRHGGKFLLRVEDTDKKRSTQEAIDAILSGLKWMGLPWDDDVTYQSEQETRHAEIVEELLAKGHAYRCYCTAEELAEMRASADAEKRPARYDRRWRDRDASEAPSDIQPAIRLKAPLEGTITIHDLVQGEVTVNAEEIDDLIIQRSDGTPTYMLAVVVDDHDMGVTHIIRGVDHLTNSFKQAVIYQLLGWDIPKMAHIPLIHGPDGAKLSKRHGALGVEAYHEMGFLPEAMRNYLLRLGWAHGDTEIISDTEAQELFSLEGVGKSPSRFDIAKLTNLNAHYLRHADAERLLELILPIITQIADHTPDPAACQRILHAMPALTERAETLPQLAEGAAFYSRRWPFDDKAQKLLAEGGQDILSDLAVHLTHQEDWTSATLESIIKEYAEQKELKLGKVAQPLRAALVGRTVSPGIFDVLEVLGKTETLARLSALD